MFLFVQIQYKFIYRIRVDCDELMISYIMYLVTRNKN